jgi:hypothetical protein
MWSDNVASVDRRLRLLERMQKVRQAKMNGEPFIRFHSDFVGQLLMSESLGISQAKASNNWMVTGEFGLTPNNESVMDTAFPNALLTCANPIGPIADFFYDVDSMDRELVQSSGWLLEVDPEDDLVFAPHAIDSPFQDWDPSEVISAYDRLVDDEDLPDGNCIMLAYEEFVQDVAQIFRDICLANFVSIDLQITTGMLDFVKAAEKIRFDRISTGISCDVFGTEQVLESCHHLLDRNNPFAAIITHHRVWRMIMGDQR